MWGRRYSWTLRLTRVQHDTWIHVNDFVMQFVWLLTGHMSHQADSHSSYRWTRLGRGDVGLERVATNLIYSVPSANRLQPVFAGLVLDEALSGLQQAWSLQTLVVPLSESDWSLTHLCAWLCPHPPAVQTLACTQLPIEQNCIGLLNFSISHCWRQL